MQSTPANQALSRWPELAPWIYVPHSDQDYERLVVLLDQLTDQVGENESHPMASLMEIVGVLVERYEEQHVPELADPVEQPNEKSSRTRSIELDEP